MRHVVITALLCLCAAPTATVALRINPRWFGFSSYLGPVVNLTYDDAAVRVVSDTLRPGTLRYPGGSIANNWNYANGRWVASVTDMYAARTNAFPPGTFGPAAYLRGFGGAPPSAPIWNLNLVTAADPPAQLDLLRSLGVAAQFVELGNEQADHDLEWYFAAAAPVANRTRQLFPRATVSAIGCFGHQWASCAPQLKAKRFAYGNWSLFDAVSIHNYSPTNATIMRAPTDALRRSATLAAVYPTLQRIEHQVATGLGNDVGVWLDEFNWGGSWSGAVTWPNETRGALRGLHWAANVLAAIRVTSHAQASGRTGFTALCYYSLFYQSSSPWSKWASIASVPNTANTPSAVAFDGVAQIIAHINTIAMHKGYTWVWPLTNVSAATVPASTHAPTGPCVLAAEFTAAASSSNWTIVAINVCPSSVFVKWPPTAATDGAGLHQTLYNGVDVGGWTPASAIGSLSSPPWQNGPISAAVQPNVTQLPPQLPGLTLGVWTTRG